MPPIARRGNAKAIALGPGKLRVAPLGSAVPVNLDVPWPAAWGEPFYTEEGSRFSYEVSFEGVPVAEELDDLDDAATGRVMTVGFAGVEITAAALRRSMNGGQVTSVPADTATGARAFDRFTPPELGDELYVMIGFESEDGQERWIWYQCKQTGAIETGRAKGNAKATLPNSFKVYKPAAGGPPFESMIDRARSA